MDASTSPGGKKVVVETLLEPSVAPSSIEQP
eukprot:CAMPEP_0181522918 /NCGR_PEP_ID=MMETSP1110-20121109/67628_1 /TAXON_ID=174948 /ORGANISM="Symbiodinium sp., Strain CCMP421" /LENGTH=30 /DNA_ID= /DNA_START= /DNA_END= /DNA_ORIENTATION=